jgi:O-antigen/teichoic acid export membrane protein
MAGLVQPPAPGHTRPARPTGSRILNVLRDSWIVAMGSVLGIRAVSVGAAFLGNVLVARQLGPARNGQFAILFAMMTVVAGLTGPALDTSLVRFAARHITAQGDRSAPYFKLVFRVKLWMGAILVLAGVILARPLLDHFLQRADEVTAFAVVLAFLGGAVMTLWGFAQSYFQAHQKFIRYAGPELLNSAARLAMVILLILAGVQTVFPVLAVYVAAPALVAVVSLAQLPGGLLHGRIEPGIGREFYHFAKWVVLASLFTSVAQRLDLLLLGYFSLPLDLVGNYGAAVNLVLLGDMLVLTFYQVLLPKASRIKTADEMGAFLRRFSAPAVLCGVAAAPLILFSDPIARLTFGAAYTQTGRIFAILLCGTLATIGCTPASTAVYGLGRSRIIAGLEGIRLALSFAVGLWVVPRYGVFGMAWTVTAIRGTISVGTYLAARLELARIRREGRPLPSRDS